jgi:hypothetical protein
MASLTGKEAEAFHEELKRREAEASARRLAEAKAAAAQRGKEPFSLEKLETMCDTSQDGELAPIEVRRARYEEMYYVEHPEYTTLAELADLVTRLSRW